MDKAFLTGAGLISCAGASPAELFGRALAGETGIRDGLGLVGERQLRDLPERIRDRARRERLVTLARDLPANKAALMTCFAIAQAMENAGWEALGPEDGLLLATTTGQIPLWENPLAAHFHRPALPHALTAPLRAQPLASLLEAARRFLDFTGPATILTSACAASTQAVCLAQAWVSSGRARRVLVGGTEVLCELTVEGFRSLKLLSPQACAPFDVARSGINLSEASAFLCLEVSTEGHAPPRAHCAITGGGMSTDGYHLTAPEPEGAGAYQAMRDALRRADLGPSDIDWVHAHGTGSQHNDAAEGAAIARLFREASEPPYATSTKWLHGHALGASGTLELALCAETLRAGKLLRTGGLRDPDPAIGLRHARANLDHPVRHILKSTLGFGGANAAVVLSRTTVHSAPGDLR